MQNERFSLSLDDLRVDVSGPEVGLYLACDPDGDGLDRLLLSWGPDEALHLPRNVTARDRWKALGVQKLVRDGTWFAIEAETREYVERNVANVSAAVRREIDRLRAVDERGRRTACWIDYLDKGLERCPASVHGILVDALEAAVDKALDREEQVEDEPEYLAYG